MISSSVSAAINHLLAREPWARAELVRHAGKIACIDTGVAAVRLSATADGMVQPVDVDHEANVTIRLKLADLPLLLQDRERAFSYVRIEGDADFANTISRLSQSLRWEAEEDLSKLIGDIPATRLVAGVKIAVKAAGAAQQRLTENLAEYFLEEKPLLVRPQAVSDFSTEVAVLRDDVERLSKRIEKLEGSR